MKFTEYTVCKTGEANYKNISKSSAGKCFCQCSFRRIGTLVRHNKNRV